jgi:hypothetical protein
LVQRNNLATNTLGDFLFGYVDAVQFASNCAGAPLFVNGSTEYSSRGACGDANGRSSPTAVVAAIAPVAVGRTVTLDGSGSIPAIPGTSLSYNWLVNGAGPVFLPTPAPSPVFFGAGSAKQAVTFAQPGMFDIDLTVVDPYLGGQAHTQLAVLPKGKNVGATASTWTCIGCPTGPVDDPTNGLAGTAVKLTTDVSGIATITTPVAQNLGYNASAATTLGFFVRTLDPDNNGIVAGAPTPVITLSTNRSGSIVYTPQRGFMDNADWTYVAVPLSPSSASGWNIANNGGSLSEVDAIQIVLNGQGYFSSNLSGPVVYWVQAVTFY